MGKHTKIWLIIGTALVLVGCIIFGGMMMALKWDFNKLSTVKFETNSYNIEDDFHSISIKSSTADILFISTQDEVASVVCFEKSKAKHTVSVVEGTLTISQKDERKWYDNIGITLHYPEIKVFLPQQQYDALTIRESTGDVEIPAGFTFETIDISLSTGDVTNYASASNIKITASTGDILAENISADTMALSVSTGKVTARSIACKDALNVTVTTGDARLRDVVCNTLTSTGSTGDISLENVTAAESFSITRTTGDVEFQSCDAGALSLKTSTGSVTGSLLSEKIFITQTSTGNVTVPQSTTGGICEISCSTGDIKITIG